jgi:hypothetical protein
MSFATICNGAAWLACGVTGFFLLRDFVKTESQMKAESREEEPEHADKS